MIETMEFASITGPRDPVRKEQYYRDFINREIEGIGAYLAHNNPVLLGSVTNSYLRVARAGYSGGASVGYCLHWLRQAADAHRRFLSEGYKFKLGGPGNIDDYLELYSGAVLVDQGPTLVQVRRQCTYTENPHPGVMGIITHFLDLIEGKQVVVQESEEAKVAAIKKEWQYLPRLFAALSSHDVLQATHDLSRHLQSAWSPTVEKWARAALKSPHPEYTGKWSFFSAAACKMLGTVMNLDAKALAYVPIELIDPPHGVA